ncbi:MAG: CD1247 N-terminal domain-containing protein [Clostridia bacterium]
MGYLSERVSYLRGLADGLKIDEETNEGKLFKLIIDVIDDIAVSVEDAEDTQNELLDAVDEIEERLDEAEECLYDECDDCCCGEDTEFAELECPNCGAEIELDKAVIDEDKNILICPNCKEEIQIEWIDECDEDCCCCDHDCSGDEE